MRRFSADYLEDTRRGMWERRGALADLDLPNRDRVLDVGCGNGALTRVIREESDADVVGLDADAALLRTVDADGRVIGDATRLPFVDDAFDLVVCQALLINLPEPAVAVQEFARVSADLVAAVEPDNAGVRVDSTVGSEAELSRRARKAYIGGVETDVALGPDVEERFRAAGVTDLTTRIYRHRQIVEPPYSANAVEGAAKKVTGTRLADKRSTMLASGLTNEAFDDLRADWRAMGREIVDQMQAGEYEREEEVPFYVTVGTA